MDQSDAALTARLTIALGWCTKGVRTVGPITEAGGRLALRELSGQFTAGRWVSSSQDAEGFVAKWSGRGSNPHPQHCERCALPIELPPRLCRMRKQDYPLE